jgi:hypothetical protein
LQKFLFLNATEQKSGLSDFKNITMKAYNNLFICISAALLMFSCSKPTQPCPPNTVKLEQCLLKNLQGQNVSLCFDKVIEDSRCPINAECVWAGRALAKFTFTANNHSQSFVLIAGRSMSPYAADTTIDGFKIKFVNLLPYPGDVGSEVRAEVEISK